MNKPVLKMLTLLFIVAIFVGCRAGEETLFGTWELQPQESTDMATWRYRTLTLEIGRQGEHIVLLQKWRRGNEPFFVDSLSFVPSAEKSMIPVTKPHWPDNWYMGVLAIPGRDKSVTGTWLNDEGALQVTTVQPVQTSQGEHLLHTTMRFSPDEDGEVLRVEVQRETRPTPVVLIFKRVAR